MIATPGPNPGSASGSNGHVAPIHPQSALRDPLTPRPLSPATRRFLWIFSVVMLSTAGIAFTFKLIEFFMTFLHEKTVRFAIVPLLTYLIVAAGYGCLFVWSYLKGHYKDVEAAKYRMLQMQDEIDAMED